jgi:hypothetical protein
VVARLKVARTLRDSAIDRVQGAVPLQAPVQPTNVDELLGSAVRVTVASDG